jgi:hypothetical protein
MSRDSTQATSGTVDNSGKALLQRPELVLDGRLELQAELQLGLGRTHDLVMSCQEQSKDFASSCLTDRSRPDKLRFPLGHHHPHLRLVADLEERFDVPRKYDQSTSGRIDSTGTAPALSRSSAIAVDSAIRSFVESALRRYPRDVPQRSAYDICSSTSRELRYVRRTSDISRTLPDSKVVAIGVGNSLRATRSHNERMSLTDTRRRRLRILIDQYGSQRRLAEACGFESDNYISQLLSPKKPFGEKVARKIEAATRKPEKWLDSIDEQDLAPPSPWPFGFDRTLWDRLPPAKQREIENAFQQLVLGASVQEAATPVRKRQA